MEISNYLQIKKQLPLNVNLLAVSKGFSSKEIKIINNLGQNDFGESRFQEAIEKKLLLDDLKNITIKTYRYKACDKKNSLTFVFNSLSICFICIAIFLRK